MLLEKFPDNTVMQIQMWNSYLSDKSGLRLRYLVKHSMDGVPINPNPDELSRITFRYTPGTWFGEIKWYLIEHQIPVSMEIVSALANAVTGIGPRLQQDLQASI